MGANGLARQDALCCKPADELRVPAKTPPENSASSGLSDTVGEGGRAAEVHEPELVLNPVI